MGSCHRSAFDVKQGAIRPAFLAAFALTSLLAQDITKGNLSGVIHDSSGAVIQNAKVRLSAPFGDRQTATDGAGVYMFPRLNAGTGYAVTVEVPGFRTAKVSRITVPVDAQVTQDITLEVGEPTYTVEVNTAASGIDLAATGAGATLDERLYTNVPVGRSLSSLITMAPGVADSGGAGLANPSVSGASGLENTYFINGMDTTDSGFGGFGTYSRVFGPLGSGVNFDFIQEVQVQTGGFEARYGQALGGIINALTKSGSNTYHGTLYSYFQPAEFERRRPDTNPVLTNKTTYIERAGSYDFGGDVGGYLIKNKLFWCAGFNPRFNHQYQWAAQDFANYQLGAVDFSSRSLNYFTKLNYNLGAKHQFEASVFGDPTRTPTTYARGLNAGDDLRTSSLDYGSRTWTVRYNGAWRPNWLVSVSYGEKFNTFTETPKYNGYQVTDSTPSQEGRGSDFTYNGLGFFENFTAKTRHLDVSSSNLLNKAGRHAFEYGYQFSDEPYEDVMLYTGANVQIPNLPEFGPAAGQTMYGAILLRTHADPNDISTPIVMKVVRSGYTKPGVTARSRYHAGFIQDAWALGGRLIIKPGLRFEQQSMEGTTDRYVFPHNWSPRIGVVFDPTGRRNAKIFAHWGRYFEKFPQDISIRTFSWSGGLIGQLYRDPGPNKSPDLTPANYIPGSFAVSGVPEPPAPGVGAVYPGSKAQYQNEAVAGYEHLFSNRFTISGRFIYRHLRRVLEDLSGVNVTQALAGVPQRYVIANPSAQLDIFGNARPCSSGPNCDPSTGFTRFANDNPLGSDGIPDGFPNPTRIYRALQIIVSRRFTDGLQLYANYTFSKLWGNYQGSFRSDNLQTDPNISSLFDFTNSDGILTGQTQSGALNTDRRHMIKIFTHYQRRNFNLGMSWNIMSGTPVTGLLDHPVYLNAGEIADGPRGKYGRTDWIYPLDIRAEYAFKVSERGRLRFIADLFNVTNQLHVFSRIQALEVDGSPGQRNPDFLKTATYQNPFSARVAVRFEF